MGCAFLRSSGIKAIRHVPIIILLEEDQQNLTLKHSSWAVSLSICWWILTKLHSAVTQIRRKKYQEAIKSNYQKSVSLAVTDGLTKVYNRHYHRSTEPPQAGGGIWASVIASDYGYGSF